jgi:hypothetical protein
MAAFALGAAVLVTAVACGGKSEAEQAEELILGAAAATFAEGTAQVFVGFEGLGEGAGQVDFENGLSQVDLELDGDTTSVIVDGTDVYVGQDGSFTRDLSGLPDLGTLLLYLQPIQALQILNGAQGDVDIVGDDDIDGVAVTQYRVTIDLQAALDALDGAARQALQDAIDRAGVGQVTVDVWLDEDGVVRRMVSTFELDDGTTETVTLEFSAFGEPVRIRVPRPRQVLESADQFLLATAEVEGRYRGTTEFSGSTDTAVWQNGAGERFTVVLSCRPNGDCRNSESGNPWESSGPGEFTVTSTFVGDCVDDFGNVTTPGGYEDVTTATWTVTAAEDGVATEITQSGTIEGRVTPAGVAQGCTFPGGGTTGSVQLGGTITRR